MRQFSATSCIILLIQYCHFPGDQTECPDQSWLYVNGSCYQKLPGAYNNWNDGKSKCENLANGAHLVVINSKIENDFVRGMAYPDAIWLGCWDEGHEGSWECSDQSGKTYDYDSQTGVGYWGEILMMLITLVSNNKYYL